MPNLRKTSGFTLIELMFVVGVIGVVSAIALPMFEKTVSGYRTTGAARSLTNEIAVGKIRAAATFKRVRIYVDLSSNTHHLEFLDRTVTPNHWTTEGGTNYLPTGVSFGYASVADPPPQVPTVPTPMYQSVKCLQDDNVTEIANTACITFNSRGVPVDTTGAAVSTGVLYLTDGTDVWAVTAAPTGMIRLWRRYLSSGAEWVAQ